LILLLFSFFFFTKEKPRTHSDTRNQPIKWKLANHHQQGVCHIVALPFTLQSILSQKNNYENSNISPCKNYNLPKIPLKGIKILQDIIILLIENNWCLSSNSWFSNLWLARTTQQSTSLDKLLAPAVK
jgi:hypothetical protein